MVDDHNREAVRPLLGTLWAWEPRKAHAACLIEVTRTWWNGEEWWVTARIVAAPAGDREKIGREYPNELSRFWEACHRVSKNPGPAGYHPDAVRRGAPQADERSAR